MRYCQILLLAFVLSSSNALFGQAPNLPSINASFRPDVQKLSPNAYAFMKYADMPVSKYTGIPNITIPIFGMDLKQANVSVSLSYHAGGIKVEEEASSVGLGWNLNVGGQITRAIKGKDDFSSNGYYKSPNIQLNEQQINNSNGSLGYITKNDYAFLYMFDQSNTTFINGYQWLHNGNAVSTNLSCNVFDPEPDVFAFQAGEYSGKFMIDKPTQIGQEYTIKLLEVDRGLKIELLFNQSNLNIPSHSVVGDPTCLGPFSLPVIKITTPSGVVYEYATTDLQSSITAMPTGYGRRLHENITNYYSETEKLQVTTWHVTRIINPNGEVITFSYNESTDNIIGFSRAHSVIINGFSTSTNSSGSPQLTNESNFLNLATNSLSPSGVAWDITKTVSYQRRVASITSNNFKLEFEYLNDRIDVKCLNNQSAARLHRIILKNVYDNTIIKGWVLQHGYFDSNSGSANHYSKRLKLLQVQEIDNTLSSTLTQPFSIEYTETIAQQVAQLPDKDSYNQDYWGFYNGQNNDDSAGTLAPFLHEIANFNNYSTTYRSRFSKRFPDESKAGIWNIKSIRYPTGGSTFFYFEMHDFSNLPAIISTNTLAAGNIQGMPIGYGPNTTTPYGNPILKGGGFRVARMLTHDAVNNQVSKKAYKYNLAENSSISSGKLMFPMVFHYAKQPTNALAGAAWIYLSSIPSYGISNSAAGGNVGYSRVEEYVNDLLQTVVEYMNTEEWTAANFVGLVQPLGPGQSSIVNFPQPTVVHDGNSSINKIVLFNTRIPVRINFSNGTVLKEMMYKVNNSIPEQVASKIYTYSFIDSSILTCYNLEYIPPFGATAGAAQFRLFGYNYFIGNTRLSKITTSETAFNVVSNSETNYTYTDYDLPKSIITTNSKGEQIESTVYYPTDLIQQTSVYPNYNRMLLNTLVANNELNTPIITVSKIDGEQIERSEMLPINLGMHNGRLVNEPALTNLYGINNSLKNTVIVGYDALGNMRSINDNSNVPSVIISGYNGTQILAEIKGALPGECAFTSFEKGENAGQFDNWNFQSSGQTTNDKFNGSYAYQLSYGQVILSNRTIDASQNIKVYVWVKSGTGSITVNGQTGIVLETLQGWNRMEFNVPTTTQVTLAGTATIDDLIMLPAKAFSQTITHQIGVGPTSIRNTLGHIRRFEYDPLGRLKAERDKDGNILKLYNITNIVSPPTTPYVFFSHEINTDTYMGTCPSGLGTVPTKVFVKDGKYYSLTSQSSANALATADANAQITCRPRPVVNNIIYTGGTNVQVQHTIQVPVGMQAPNACKLLLQNMSNQTTITSIAGCNGTFNIGGLSGNTWYRVFVIALYNNGVEIASEPLNLNTN